MKNIFLFILFFGFNFIFSQNNSVTTTKAKKQILVKKPVKKVDAALDSILKGNKKNIDTSTEISAKNSVEKGTGTSGNGIGYGTGKRFGLTGRKALSKPKPIYKCNEEGIVVVQIIVDRNGNVIDAKSGARGTTNSAVCLLKESEKSARLSKWEPNPNAPEKQVGTISYNFSLKD